MPEVLEQEQNQIETKKEQTKMEELKATGQIAGENKPRPLKLVIALLSEMTDLATEAERERDANKERADEWYRHFQTKNAMCQALQKKLDDEIAAHECTKIALKDARALLAASSKPEE